MLLGGGGVTAVRETPISSHLVRSTFPFPLRSPEGKIPEEDSLCYYHNLSSGLSPQGTTAGKKAVNVQAVATVYCSLRTELNQVHSKITELDMEVNQHSLVIIAIRRLYPSRWCYRMIGLGGILVERIVREFPPAFLCQKEGLEEVIVRLNVALENKKKEITDFETI